MSRPIVFCMFFRAKKNSDHSSYALTAWSQTMSFGGHRRASRRRPSGAEPLSHRTCIAMMLSGHQLAVTKRSPFARVAPVGTREDRERTIVPWEARREPWVGSEHLANKCVLALLMMSGSRAHDSAWLENLEWERAESPRLTDLAGLLACRSIVAKDTIFIFMIKLILWILVVQLQRVNDRRRERERQMPVLPLERGGAGQISCQNAQ